MRRPLLKLPDRIRPDQAASEKTARQAIELYRGFLLCKSLRVCRGFPGELFCTLSRTGVSKQKVRGGSKGPLSSIWHYKIVSVVFGLFRVLGKSKSLRDTGQNTPKCCKHLGAFCVQHVQCQESANKAVFGPKQFTVSGSRRPTDGTCFAGPRGGGGVQNQQWSLTIHTCQDVHALVVATARFPIAEVIASLLALVFAMFLRFHRNGAGLLPDLRACHAGLSAGFCSCPFSLQTQENKRKTAGNVSFFLCAKARLRETLVIFPSDANVVVSHRKVFVCPV